MIVLDASFLVKLVLGEEDLGEACTYVSLGFV